jgi:hypothetical protein
MKRIVTISLMLLIMFSGISVKIALHYCGGSFSEMKVSLSGKLATCGMEHQSGKKSSQDLITRHCCNDIISSFSIDTNYVPSNCYSLPDLAQEINHSFILQNAMLINPEITVSAISGDKKPPGNFSPFNVEQQVLCIFRI